MTIVQAAGAVLGLSLAFAVTASGCTKPTPPPVLKVLPAFSLTAEDGTPFGSRELAGAPYVASFFFTSCPSVCPRIIRAVGDLQARLAVHAPSVRLISVTVDPETDTPAVLAAYAQSHGADPNRWRFLTGSAEAVRRTVVDGFMTPLGERDVRDDGLFDIAHGSRLMLVDGDNRLRGLYDTDPAGLDALTLGLRAIEDQ